MTLAQACLSALMLLPLLAAAVCVLLPHPARRVTGALVAVAVVVLAVPVVSAVTGGAVPELGLAGHEAPLGIILRADGLSALFIGLTAVVGLAVTGYAALLPAGTGTRIVRTGAGGVRWEASHPGFWPLWLACWAGLNAVFVSGDLFNTYVGLELASLSAVGLVALGGRASWPAALRYLFIAVLGSLLFLVAVGLIVSVTGTLDLARSARVMSAPIDLPPGPARQVALILMNLMPGSMVQRVVTASGEAADALDARAHHVELHTLSAVLEPVAQWRSLQRRVGRALGTETTETTEMGG